MIRASLALLALLAPGFAQTPADPLKTLRPEHPRLILLDRDLPALRSLIQQDPLARQVYQRLAAEAGQLQNAPTPSSTRS